MILNKKDCIFTRKGVERRELLRQDQALIYRSRSKIETTLGAGKATAIYSTTITRDYCWKLSKMKGFVHLDKEDDGGCMCKNVYLYSESAVYLDGVNRIANLFPVGKHLKVCECDKETQGCRYSSLYKILEGKLLRAGFNDENECFLINRENVETFVDVINEICEEQSKGKYELVKSEKIDELSSGVFNIAYWRYKGEDEVEKSSNQVENLTLISHDLITKIDLCNDLKFLTKLEQEISIIQGFCKSKIEVLKLIQ